MRDRFASPPRDCRMLQIVHGLGRYRREMPGGLAGLADAAWEGVFVVFEALLTPDARAL